MDTGTATLCDNLIAWLKTVTPLASRDSDDPTDGVAVADALVRIAPDFFTVGWYSKIKPEVGDNWRLKVSNLKKIVQRIIDYYSDVLTLSLGTFPKPDVTKIAEDGDVVELGRLLQLVLGCAVNCDQQQEYITKIKEMEISCQWAIMQAIQELDNCIHSGNRSSFSLELGGNAFKFQSETEAREVLAQRCHELDLQVRVLSEEKATLLTENQKLLAKLREGTGNISESVDDRGESIGPALSGTVRYNDMRRQVDLLKDEIFKIETVRDDYKAKTVMQEKELNALYAKMEELQIAAGESAQLKDEVDALRESADKVLNYESTIESYKKRMEDYVDVKKQVKILEQKCVEYVQKSIEQEEDIKKMSVFKAQLEIYKKQVSDLHEKLDAEITKADKLEIENKKINIKLSSLRREKDSLLQERDTLKETCEELRCSTLQSNNEDSVSREMIPTDLKEKLIRLEHENKLLRQNQGNQGDHTSVQNLLDDYAQRLEKQRNINREANQKIMKMEALLEEVQRNGEPDQKNQQLDSKFSQIQDECHRKGVQIEELMSSLQREKQNSKALKESLNQKEAEVLALEEKYKRSVDKAKEVVRMLDPRASSQQSLTDMNLLNNRILNDKMASTSGQAQAQGGSGTSRAQGSSINQDGMRESEERLLTSAFFKLGIACHRDAVDSRLALMASGQSFLSRQRQAVPRKPIHSFRTK